MRLIVTTLALVLSLGACELTGKEVGRTDGGGSLAQGLADDDSDGLTNDEEARLGTDPKNNDSDGDGQADGAEVAAGTDPLVAQENLAGIDTDDDGLSNAEELVAGTSPTLADTDQDSLNDGAEIKVHRTNPLKADTDGGGAFDGAELSRSLNALDPTDDAQLLPISIQFTKTPLALSVALTSGFIFDSQPKLAAMKYTCVLSNSLNATLVTVPCQTSVEFQVKDLKPDVTYRLTVTVENPLKVKATSSFEWKIKGVALACGQANGVTTLQKTFSFGAGTSTCAFGTAPNLVKKNGFYQAVRTATVPLGIANTDKLCSVAVKINQASFLADDEFVVHMGDIPLATNSLLTLSQGTTEQVFDFLALRGKSHGSSVRYCFGSPCTLPPDGTAGAIAYTSNSQLINRVRARAAALPSLTISLSVLGDDDDGDCKQSGLSGVVDYTIAK